MVLGDGSTTFLWEDRWLDGKLIQEIAPDLYVLIPKRHRKRRSVAQALIERCWITDIVGALTLLALW
jgi:hypothetical protein